VGGNLRILIGASPDGATRIARLLREASGEDVELATESPARASELASVGSYDALVLEWSDSADVRAAVESQPPMPVVLVSDDYSAEVATLGHRTGVAVCLLRHGAKSLSEAITGRRGRPESAALRTLIERAPIGMALLDADGRIVRSNRALEKFLERPAQLLRGVTLGELEDRAKPETFDDLRRSIVDRTGDHERVETRYRGGDGQVVSGLETLLHGTSRSGAFAIAIVEDASTRLAMEAAVRASESVRALVYVSVADVIFYLRVEHDRFRFVEVNPAFLRATGLLAEQVVGKFVDEVIPEPSLSLVLARYREAISERRTVRWEEITPYPSGKKYGEVSVTPLVDPDGVCRSLVGTVHDVTELRRSEETIRLYAEIVRSVQIGLTVWDVTDASDPRSIRLRAFNPMAEHTSGVHLTSRVGQPLVEIFPLTKGTELVELVCDVAREGTVRELRAFRFFEGQDLRTYAVKAFPLEANAVGLAVEDVTTEVRARTLNAVEQRVLEMIASGRTLEETLTALVVAIEEHAPPAIGSVLLLSPDGKRVTHGAAPHLPEAFNRAVDGAPIGPAAGSCGTAAYLRRSVIVADIETDPLWSEYRELARPFGLRACWSTPILASNGRVLGTFALYYREPRTPTTEEMELIARANHVAGIAIQRHDLDEQLRGLAARLEEVREEERTEIARDIHDELGQMLTALKMDIAWIARRATSPEGLARDALLDRVRELSEMTDSLVHEVRRISAQLRPGILDDLGLDAALSWEAEEFERRTNIECRLRSELQDKKFSRELATAVFRTFQEALTNVIRHADAKHVNVTVTQSEDSLVLEVRDDGRGIRAEQIDNPRSLGLVGIRERARRAGGTASFSAGESGGTVVTLRLPLNAPPASRS